MNAKTGIDIQFKFTVENLFLFGVWGTVTLTLIAFFLAIVTCFFIKRKPISKKREKPARTKNSNDSSNTEEENENEKSNIDISTEGDESGKEGEEKEE